MCICGAATAQNIGINATGATPAASAMLDIAATDKKVCLYRIVSIDLYSCRRPVTTPATNAFAVYNTAAAGTSPSNVTPGFYYWSGSAWIAAGYGEHAGQQDLGTYRNARHQRTTNFMGTTDAIDLVVRTNNTEQLRVTQRG